MNNARLRARQVAATLCCALVGYLSLATTCLRAGGDFSVETPVHFAANETMRALRFSGVSDQGLTDILILTPGGGRLYIPETELRPDLTVDEREETQSDSGALALRCTLLQNCEEFILIVERATAGEAEVTSVEVQASIGGNCDGDPAKIVELRLEELQ